MNPRSKRWSASGVSRRPFISIEPLPGRFAGAPRLNVAGLQQGGGGNAREPAGPFDLLEIGTEDTLPAPGGNNALSFRVIEREVASDPPLNSIFDSLNDALVAQTV